MLRLRKPSFRPELRHWLFGLATIPLCAHWLLGDCQEALLAPDTLMHFVFAALAATAFLWVTPLTFGQTEYDRRRLLGVFLFTGSVGMVFLHGVYWLALKSRTTALSGTLDASFFWHVIRLIDVSSTATDNVNAGFLQSFFGYLFGVGLPEEFVKIIPVWFIIERRVTTRWSDALVVGVISGVGFGIAEGLHYSERFYNGAAPGIMYLTRFISCVGLHAAWSGIAALQVERNRSKIFGGDNILVVVVMLLLHLSPAILLHGLYDAFLKLDMSGVAVLTAIASFVSLSVLIERARVPDADASDREQLRHIRAKVACDGMDSLTSAEFQILQRARRATRPTKSPVR